MSAVAAPSTRRNERGFMAVVLNDSKQGQG
jgi:hypothetical protein